MRIEAVLIGSELLNGRKSDAHSAWLGGELAGMGGALALATLVADEAGAMEEALRNALGRAELVFACGGLGPTLDDITRDVAAKVAGSPLREDPALVAHLKSIFERRDRVMPPNNLRQAQVPEGATVLDNPAGSAPGLRVPCRGPFEGRTLILLPGPPRELRTVFDKGVRDWLRERLGAKPLASRRIMTWGLGESAVDELLKGLVPEGDTHTLAMLAGVSGVELRLSHEDEARVNSLEAEILRRLGEHVYSTEGKSLEETVGELLKAESMSVALAESCTGGRVASRLTSVPGASAWFKAGLVTYSNESKTELLEVPPFVIKKAGAVSKDTALAMAVGLARRFDTDFSVAVTGVAGPGGGTPEKPVGTVHLALAGPAGIRHQEFHFTDAPRELVQARAAQAALFLLFRELAGLEVPEQGTDRATVPGPAPR